MGKLEAGGRATGNLSPLWITTQRVYGQEVGGFGEFSKYSLHTEPGAKDAPPSNLEHCSSNLEHCEARTSRDMPWLAWVGGG